MVDTNSRKAFVKTLLFKESDLAHKHLHSKDR